jgi:hypothetical protein
MTGLESLGDGERILAVLAILYLSEGAWWLPQSTACFAARWRHYRPVRAAAFLKNERGGLVFFGLAPFSTPLVCQPLPLCLSPAGIRLDGGRSVEVEAGIPSRAAPLGYDEFQSIEQSDRELFINGRAARCGSTEMARFLVDGLAKIQKAPPQKREAVLDEILLATTDTDAVAERLKLLRERGLAPTLASTTFFLYTFVLGYLLLCLPEGVTDQALIYLAGFFACWVASGLCFWLAHRGIFPEQRRERGQRIAMMLFVPTAAMRAPATLSRNLLGSFHPLAVASVLCPPETFRRLAQTTLLSLNHVAHPSASADETSEDAISVWFYSRMLRQLSTVVQKNGLDPSELLRPPSPDPDALSYCPRCHAQFVVASGVCPDCENVALIGFATPSVPT